jgi:hypothetical protein
MSKFAAETSQRQFASHGDCFNAISRVWYYLEIAGYDPSSKNTTNGHLKLPWEFHARINMAGLKIP